MQKQHYLALIISLWLVLSACTTSAPHSSSAPALSNAAIQDLMLSNRSAPSQQTLVWQSLLQLTPDQLTALNSDDQRIAGWIELARIGQNNTRPIKLQVDELQAWEIAFPFHPAAQAPLHDLQLLKQLAVDKPHRIALILPLSGRLAAYGQAIRDGFVAAWYISKQQGADVPEITLYDSHSDQPFITLYQRAIDEGAQMVLGPLEKSHLQQLAAQRTLPVPTLAFNRIDSSVPPQLYQLRLATEDEAEQLATLAYQDQHRQAMVIAPQSEWGEKVSAAFAERWQPLGGEVVAQLMFDEQSDTSAAIEQALQLPLSAARKKRVATLVGESLEFAPRRRQDIDMVLLLAKPTEARSIKPLLNYHYAGDLPVYATSRTYAGVQDANKNQDLNGVQLITLPWFITASSPVQQAINKLPTGALQEMVALGIDSFYLYPRLYQLERFPYHTVTGEAGEWRMNAQRELYRSLPVAKFTRGHLVAQ